MFTPEEVKAAKATRDAIIKENIPELKSIYMAGEIVMWDEMQAKNIYVTPDVSGQFCDCTKDESDGADVNGNCVHCGRKHK